MWGLKKPILTPSLNSPWKIPESPVDYPSGICVVTEKGKFYINGSYRNPVKFDRVFDSWDFPVVVQSTEKALARYPVMKKLGFRTGTVVERTSTGQCYVLSGSKWRLIVNPDVFPRLGLCPEDALMISDEEFNLHDEGEELN